MAVHRRSKLTALRLLAAVVIATSCGGGASVAAADLPQIGIEHLYYLRARGDYLRRLTSAEMVEYCVAQKIGGRAFDDLYVQLFLMRVELSKLQKIEGASEENPRVKTLKKTLSVQTELLEDEARRVQSGLIREGHLAFDALEAMGRAQQSR